MFASVPAHVWVRDCLQVQEQDTRMFKSLNSNMDMDVYVFIYISSFNRKLLQNYARSMHRRAPYSLKR